MVLFRPSRISGPWLLGFSLGANRLGALIGFEEELFIVVDDFATKSLELVSLASASAPRVEDKEVEVGL